MTTNDRDERLLLALGRNARLSVVELARIVGLSRSATQERLQRLERDGTIAGYTVLLGARKTGQRARAWLAVRYGADGSCPRSLAALQAIPEVRSAHSLAGEIDLLLEVDAADVEALERVRVRVGAIPGVAAVRTHVVLATHFESRALAEAEPHARRTPAVL